MDATPTEPSDRAPDDDVSAVDPEEIDRIIREGIPDPVGSFYRFSLAKSQLRRKKKLQNVK